ncbi:MAG: hypothetical protein JW910_01735, partial [Anaerolineae bacterium]|nr:hypothetical protein [Anaerolineae bacterium]
LHGGYGTHVGPHLGSAAGYLNELGMNWVKVYDAEQLLTYRSFYTLYRMDLDWPSDWNAFRGELDRRIREAISRGADAIEIHNEPNLALEWPRGPDAWEYVQMLRVAYEVIKAIDPAVIVVSAGLAPTETTPDRRAINDLDFAREMLENGAADYLDAFGYHPYGFDQPPETDPYQVALTFRRAERIRALLVEYGAGNRPVWMTEFGWLRDPAESGVSCRNDPALRGFEWFTLPTATVADYTVRAFAYADANWPWAGPLFLWNLNWQLYDTGYEAACSHLRWYSILDPGGVRTAVYNAVVAMPHRTTPALPHLEAVPVFDASANDSPTTNGQMSFTLGAFCPTVTAVGAFEITNTGTPVALSVSVEPQPLAVPGWPRVFVSVGEAQVGDRVTIFADASDTAPGDYLLVVNLRSTYGGRLIAANARLLLHVEPSAVNCE